MKTLILPILLSAAFYNQTQACSWYDPDYEYFNLFTQSIIRDKSYTPFLLTYSEPYFTDGKIIMPDENIENWQKFFSNKLNYQQTDHLVKHISLAQLNELKAGRPTEPLLVKLGSDFYYKYREAIDYLIEAKYLEPYMRINYIENPDTFYYRSEESNKNATNLDYDKTIASLQSLYAAAKSPEIKQRYGYQIVRFNHYTRHYDKAVEAFKTYVEPLRLKNAPYYLALDQYAGALRGLNKMDEANWNFFQVLKNTKYRKADSYSSLKLGDSATFNNLLNRAQNSDDKNMAYFLLGYQDFNSPLGTMEKMYDLDPNSEALKVLAARAINELERNYLPTYYYDQSDSQDGTRAEAVKADSKANSKENAASENNSEGKKEEVSFWRKIVNFFKNLFTSSDSDDNSERSNNLSDKSYLNNKNRIPFLNRDEYNNDAGVTQDYLNEVKAFADKVSKKNDDAFWKIAVAYLEFLHKDYEESSEILSKIKTDNQEYAEQIARMQVLNTIVSQPKITPEFEDEIMSKYKDYFVEKPIAKDSTSENEWNYEDYKPTTRDFLIDILANRYFLQGEDAKSYLMNNKLSDFRYNPDPELAKKLQAFYNKNNKTSFEKEIVAKNMDDVGDINAYFNLIYGDQAMRENNFGVAVGYYKNATKFKGYDLPTETYNFNTYETVKITDFSDIYNGFNNIKDYVFGYNTMVSYNSKVDETMAKDDFVSEFSFITPKMNKLQLAEAAVQLQNIAKGKDDKASKANQLLGNLLYNTSALGYFRELFVMDIDNSNGGKYYFDQVKSPFKYYYKDYTSKVYLKPDNFDNSINYYSKALNGTSDPERKARILFQMASAEQGKFYQYEASHTPDISYDDPNWSDKMNAAETKMAQIKTDKYKTYFNQLKQNYLNTKTSQELMGSCTYYYAFMMK